MTDHDNLRERLTQIVDVALYMWTNDPETTGTDGEFVAQAIIDELRTDEAVERVADWLCEDDNGYKLSGHDEWCQDPACDLVESYRKSARDLIAALLGEDA